MEELAIFGGEPIRKDPIYYGRQSRMILMQLQIHYVVIILLADPKLKNWKEDFVK